MRSDPERPELFSQFVYPEFRGVGLGALLEHVEELRGIRRLLIEERSRPDARAVALLRAIADRVGDRVFTGPELTEFCEVSGAGELRGAVVRAVGSLSPRKIGKRFAEIEGEALGGFRIRRVGTDRLGVLWQVARVSDEANPLRIA
jgi:hypothetical protein